MLGLVGGSAGKGQLALQAWGPVLISRIHVNRPGLVAHTCSPSTREAETGGLSLAKSAHSQCLWDYSEE